MKKLQNNFTTPEQSKRLLELGVDDEIKKEEGFANNTQELDKIAQFNSRQQKLFDL